MLIKWIVTPCGTWWNGSKKAGECRKQAYCGLLLNQMNVWFGAGQGCNVQFFRAQFSNDMKSELAQKHEHPDSNLIYHTSKARLVDIRSTRKCQEPWSACTGSTGDHKELPLPFRDATAMPVGCMWQFFPRLMFGEPRAVFLKLTTTDNRLRACAVSENCSDPDHT
jgi:hypothetical protein